MARGALLLRRQAPLAYPGGNPRFDPSHIASGACLFSGVSTPGSFLNLLNGQPGTNISTPVAAIDGYIGPITKYTGASTQETTFPFPTTAFIGVTLAGIVRMDAFGNSTQQIINNSSGGTSWGLCGDSNSPSSLQFSTAGIDSTFTTGDVIIQPSVPYFIVASNTTAPNSIGASRSAIGVKVNLLTGKIAILGGNSGSTTPVVGSGTLGIGNRSAAPRAVNGGIAAAAFITRAMTLPEMLEWAQDPWSFWYP